MKLGLIDRRVIEKYTNIRDPDPDLDLDVPGNPCLCQSKWPRKSKNFLRKGAQII